MFKLQAYVCEYGNLVTSRPAIASNFFWQYQFVLVKEKGLAGTGFQSHCRMQAQTKLTAKRGMNPSQNNPSTRILAPIEVDAHDRAVLTASTPEDPREKKMNGGRD